jgi:hypothetical protein
MEQVVAEKARAAVAKVWEVTVAVVGATATITAMLAAIAGMEALLLIPMAQPFQTNNCKL